MLDVQGCSVVNALGGWVGLSGVLGPRVNALDGWASIGVLDVPDCPVGECLGWVGFSRGAGRTGLFCG